MKLVLKLVLKMVLKPFLNLVLKLVLRLGLILVLKLVMMVRVVRVVFSLAVDQPVVPWPKEIVDRLWLFIPDWRVVSMSLSAGLCK